MGSVPREFDLSSAFYFKINYPCPLSRSSFPLSKLSPSLFLISPPLSHGLMAASLLVWGRGVIAPHLGRTAAAAPDRGPHRGGGLERRRRGGLEHHRERAQGSPGRRCPLGRGGPGCRCPLGRGGGPVRRGPARARSGGPVRRGLAWARSGSPVRWPWKPLPGQRGICGRGRGAQASEARRDSGRSSRGAIRDGHRPAASGGDEGGSMFFLFFSEKAPLGL